MPSRLTTRLRRLEARRPPVADPSYVPPELPLDWWRECFRLCRTQPYGADMLRTLGWSARAVQELLALGEHDFSTFIATYEDTDALTT